MKNAIVVTKAITHRGDISKRAYQRSILLSSLYIAKPLYLMINFKLQCLLQPPKPKVFWVALTKNVGIKMDFLSALETINVDYLTHSQF